jgi:hypothetical protein
MTANKMFFAADAPDTTTVLFPQTTREALPHAHVIHPFPGETLGDITMRAYGVNTATLRERILKANKTLKGPVIAPHG